MTLPCAALCFTLFMGLASAEEPWVDVSTPLVESLTKDGQKQEWPGGCSGVVVDRSTGDVTIKIVGRGLWRSQDQGKTWLQVDNHTVSGRDETGWATNGDPASPRIASFSLDGLAGWTPDGKKWQKFTTLGRNWDFGSVDWTEAQPQDIIAAKHETNPPGEVYLSRNGGTTWNQLSIHLNEKREQISMIGALGKGVFLYSKGEGIHRSTDAGATWTKVSDFQPQTRIPVVFGGVAYLGTATSLLLSKDAGATWQERGQGQVNIWQGPFFGKNEKEMLVVGKDGVFRTHDAGVTWTKAADLKQKEKAVVFSPNWFGCYAWDAQHDVLYASAMAAPVFKRKL